MHFKWWSLSCSKNPNLYYRISAWIKNLNNFFDVSMDLYSLQLKANMYHYGTLNSFLCNYSSNTEIFYFLFFSSACCNISKNLKVMFNLQKPAKCSLSEENTRHLLATFLWVVKNVDNNVLKQWWSELPCENLSCSSCSILTVSCFSWEASLPLWGAEDNSDNIPVQGEDDTKKFGGF